MRIDNLITVILLSALCWMLIIFFGIFLFGCVIPEKTVSKASPCEIMAVAHGGGDPEQEARIYLKCIGAL